MFSCKFAAYFQHTFPEEHFWTAASGENCSKISNQDDNEHKKSNFHSDKNTGKDQSNNKRIYILRDGMIKNLKAWEISKKLKNGNVYVTHFASAKVRCTKDHIKP